MPTSRGLNRSLGSAIAAIAGIAMIAGGVVFYQESQVREAGDVQDHARALLSQLRLFQIAMLNQETGIRGYLLTNQPSSLEPYEQGVPDFERAVTRLNELIKGDAEGGKMLRDAETAARAWRTDVSDKVLADAKDPNRLEDARAIESSGLGKNHFDAFRQALVNIENRQISALDALANLVREERTRLVSTLIAGTLLTLAICLAAWVTLDRRVARPLRDLADVMLRLVRRDLSVEIPSLGQRNEVGAMARAVQVFKNNLIELDRTSLLRATVDTLPAMVGYIDGGSKVGFLNAEFARWMNLRVSNVGAAQGKSLDEVLPDGELPGGAAKLESALAGEEVRFEQSFTRRDGVESEIEGYYRPHLGPGGHVLGAVALFTDVTERREMDRKLARHAAELLRSNEELEQFAYVASHDLKAPLRGIENLVSWIEEDLEGKLEGETRQNMDLLRSRVKRLESLLDDLLAYSRAGREALTPSSVDTRALIDEIAALISPPDGFQIVASASLPTILTPPAPFNQVMQNLISNAVKHHDDPAHGLIEIVAEPLGPLTMFIVRDNGSGIPKQFRERVFGMFQTLRPRDEVEGSGMGLAIVKKIVERQGGKVWISDNPAGKGASVHFTWPKSFREAQNGTRR